MGDHQVQSNAILNLESYGIIAHWLKLCLWHLATSPSLPTDADCQSEALVDDDIKGRLLTIAVQASRAQSGVEDLLANSYRTHKDIAQTISIGNSNILGA